MGLGLSKSRKPVQLPGRLVHGARDSQMAVITGTQPFQDSLMNSGHQQNQGRSGNECGSIPKDGEGK